MSLGFEVDEFRKGIEAKSSVLVGIEGRSNKELEPEPDDGSGPDIRVLGGAKTGGIERAGLLDGAYDAERDEEGCWTWL